MGGKQFLGYLLCSVSALLSAFLLFQLQPMIAKILLPMFGGGSSVWTTCLLFFQSGLFLGYLYTHGLVRWCTPRAQAVLHVALLAGSLAVMPVTVTAQAEIGEVAAVSSILTLLLISVGAPYALLASNAPLLQVWFARLVPGSTPYRLYALSNVGSLLGLLIYPFVLEPWMTTVGQTRLWSVIYAVYVVLTALVGLSQAMSPGATAPMPAPAVAEHAEPTSVIDKESWFQ